ncbi:MAG TPA: DUF4230 domain-containing protein [Verrucomicrobiae bacterium]|jgi:hypothetical protein|nr:DUF4230 domain-containing protein [Verrucomicrobiae bacterium]
MLKNMARTGMTLIVIFAVGLFFGWLTYRWYQGRGVSGFSGPALLQKVQTLSQFVTVKYTLEKVVEYDDAKWYGDSRVLLVAHGVVKAGIDLSQLAPGDVQISGKTICMTLPRARITDVYLDDRQTQIVDHTTGILRVFDKDLEQTARRQAVDELRLAASQNGIMKDAAEKGQSQLTILLYQLGFTNISLRSK